jgi:hypothetical protein
MEVILDLSSLKCFNSKTKTNEENEGITTVSSVLIPFKLKRRKNPHKV